MPGGIHVDKSLFVHWLQAGAEKEEEEEEELKGSGGWRARD